MARVDVTKTQEMARESSPETSIPHDFFTECIRDVGLNLPVRDQVCSYSNSLTYSIILSPACLEVLHVIVIECNF